MSKATVRVDAMSPTERQRYRAVMVDGPVELAILTDSERWRLACEYDGIDPRSRFVVFSDENPYR